MADQLVMRGWQVDIVFLFSRHDQSDHQGKFTALSLKCMNADGRLSRLFLPLRLARLAKDYELILSGLDLAATNYGYLAARLSRKPFLSWMHIAFNEHAKSVSKLSRAVSIWFYRRIPNLVFPSLGARNSLIEAIGGKPDESDWHIIENFHIPAPESNNTTVELFKHFFLKPVVLSVGRLSEQKAYDRLIRVHASLRQRGVEHHLVILGEGPERGQLECLAAQLEVSDSCFLPGNMSDPQVWMNASTVFALSSRYEGLPLVLIEALNSGIPIAAMDCPSGPREILDGGACGLLVPPDDESALANAIENLLKDPNLRLALAERGKKKAKEYDSESIIPRWENLLSRIIDDASHKHLKS